MYIKNKLQTKNAFDFLISAPCSNFIFSLYIAEKFIISKKVKTNLTYCS